MSSKAKPRPRRGREIFFVTCAPGLEPVLHEEARQLRLPRSERQVGGVYFEGELAEAWRANLHLRTATRVLWRLAREEARDGDALHRAVSRVEWPRFLRPQGSLIVNAHTRESRLDHSLYVAQRTKDAIVDQFRARGEVRPSVDRVAPDLVIDIHLFRDRLTISIDTSGESLHKRGWRRFQGRAPLAETIAAGAVLMSGWDRRAPLLDPYCGSGTILIEAALLASGIPPGVFRERFGFESLPGHDVSAWERLRERARAGSVVPRKLTLRGYDRDPAAIAGARQNLDAAGVGEIIDLAVGEMPSEALRPGWNAWIVTNPPYGERVGRKDDLAELYRSFGERLRRHAAGYHLALLSGNRRLERGLGLRPERIEELQNGAIPCRLLCLEIPRG